MRIDPQNADVAKSIEHAGHGAHGNRVIAAQDERETPGAGDVGHALAQLDARVLNEGVVLGPRITHFATLRTRHGDVVVVSHPQPHRLQVVFEPGVANG